MTVATKALGFEMSRQEFEEIMESRGVARPLANDMDKAPGTCQNRPQRLLVSLETFQTLMAPEILARDPRHEILSAFELFGECGKGKVSLADVRRVAMRVGEELLEDDLKAMLEEIGTGGMHKDEFVKICLRS